MPRRIPYPVTVSFGKWLPPTATPGGPPGGAGPASAAFVADRNTKLTLDRAFVRTCRRYFWRFIMADGSRPK